MGPVTGLFPPRGRPSVRTSWGSFGSGVLDVRPPTSLIPVPPPGQPLNTFGGQIDVRVEVDTGGGEGLAGLWDTALWDTDHWGSDDAIWVDFTEHVLSVSISQGTERWGERFETGTCSVTVDNTTGIFTPEIGVTDPWYRPFRPGRRIRIVAIPDPDTGLRVSLFTGRLDAAYGDAADAGHAITSTFQIYDFMADWNAYDPFETTPTGNQRTDLRVHAALDRYDWPADERDIQVGAHNVQSSTLSETTLEECQVAADAEGGVFYCSKDGLATFKNRDWLTTDARSTTIQGYIGYEEVPAGAQAAHIIGDPATSWELARIINHAAYARAGGTAQEVNDYGSQNAYGIRSHNRTDFLNTTDGEVLALAVRVVNSSKDLRPRADDIAISAVADPDNEDLNRLFWDSQLGDRVAIQASTPYGWVIEREAHIFGITHELTADDWNVIFRLDDAQTIDLTYWILEDAEFGVLNETTRAA